MRLSFLFALLALVACDERAPTKLASSRPRASSHDTAAGVKNTFDHAHESIGGGNGVTDVQERTREEASIGTPTDVARLHGAQKVSYAALGKMLADFGAPDTELYANGRSALGAPIFASRTPEMTNPSTAALAKEFDVFVAAAPKIIANIQSSRRCPGVVLVSDSQLTRDGISCLMGKPATPDHVTLANKMVLEAKDPNAGIQLAVATILAAAHISE